MMIVGRSLSRLLMIMIGGMTSIEDFSTTYLEICLSGPGQSTERSAYALWVTGKVSLPPPSHLSPLDSKLHIMIILPSSPLTPL